MSGFIHTWATAVLVFLATPLWAQSGPVLGADLLQSLKPQTVAPLSVQVVPVFRQPAEVILPPGAGQVAVAPLPGRVIQSRAVLGDAIAPGAILASLYSPEWLQLQRDLVLAHSAWQHAKHVHERESALFADGIIAQRRLDEAEHELLERRTVLLATQQTLLSLGIADAEIHALQDSHSMNPELSVRARQSGTVTAAHARLGEAVDAGEPLFEYADTTQLWLTIYVDVALSGVLREGRPVQAGPCEAQVLRVSDVLDKPTQTLIATAQVATPCALKVGQQITVQLARPQQDSYQVPATAVFSSAGRDWVFALRGGALHAQPVTVVGAAADARFVQFADEVPAAVATTRMADLKAAWLGMGGE